MFVPTNEKFEKVMSINMTINDYGMKIPTKQKKMEKILEWHISHLFDLFFSF